VAAWITFQSLITLYLTLSFAGGGSPIKDPSLPPTLQVGGTGHSPPCIPCYKVWAMWPGLPGVSGFDLPAHDVWKQGVTSQAEGEPGWREMALRTHGRGCCPVSMQW
jgi:hypothetical protein